MTQASPIKLRNGDWGAKARGSVREGDTVQITTKSGKSWVAHVAKVVWTGNGVSICATESRDSGRHGASGRRYSGSSESYCGYPCPVTGRRCCAKNGPCHDCE